MGDLSRNFDSREFACRDGCGYGQPHPRLVRCLEDLRHRIGDKPVSIRSGLRCPPRNDAVGGALRSRHQSGEAADIQSGLVRKRQAVAAGFTGIGIKNGWVIHVDVRRARDPVIWEYSGASSGG